MAQHNFNDVFGARYMRDFQCIGPECPDTCCAGWKVEVDKHHFKKIKKHLSSSPEGKKQFNQSVKRNRSGQSDDTYAVIATDKNKSCVFLDDDQLCFLQRNYGEIALPNTCASYPRSMIARGQRLEVYGVMSCPVVAETVLFSDSPFDLLDIPQSESQRLGSIRYHLCEEDAFDFFFDDIRGFILNLLIKPTMTFEQKVYVICRFAGDIHASYYRGCEISAGMALKAIVERYQQEAIIKGLLEEFNQLPETSASAVTELLQLLVLGIQSISQSSSFLKTYIESVFQQMNLDLSDDVVEASEAERFIYIYQSKKNCQDGEVWKQLDEYLLRYSINHWLSVPYLISDNLLNYVQNWVLRIASLRLLVISNPVIQTGTAIDSETVRRLALQIFQQYGRGIESRPDYIRKIMQHFETSDPITAVAQTLLFLKV